MSAVEDFCTAMTTGADYDDLGAVIDQLADDPAALHRIMATCEVFTSSVRLIHALIDRSVAVRSERRAVAELDDARRAEAEYFNQTFDAIVGHLRP